MKAIFFTLNLLLLLVTGLQAQPPALYIHLVSHNEPNDFLDNTLNYNAAKSNLLQMAAIVDSAGLKWNLQTSDGMVIGALSDESVNGTNIFKTLASAPYNDNVEIDPRSKNKGGRNIADQWYLLDSLGANPTTHLGGCIYLTTNPQLQSIDWEQYRQPIMGNVFGNLWQCSLLTGAGSYPPHQFDLKDFGVFKPDTATNFYQHNPSKNLWCMGVGCAPLLTDTTNELEIIHLIKEQIDSIQNGQWPQNKFYVTRIMTNQRDFKPAFFQKLRRVIDSLETIPASRLKWATIGETFSAFEQWQKDSGLDHSQWLCGQTVSDVQNTGKELLYKVYPNPCEGQFTIQLSDDAIHKIQLCDLLGRQILTQEIQRTATIPLSGQPAGVYIILADNGVRTKIVLE